MQKVVFASGNVGKLNEVADILAPLGLHVVPQSEFDTPPIPETGLSFVENAILKARNAAQHCGLPAIADDSGIEVRALHGQPGIYSARYAGEGATDQENNEKLIEALAGSPENERAARYCCVMVYMAHGGDPMPLISHGTWEGQINRKARGSNGFGYDPLFWVADYNCTAAELPAHIKNQLSHRGKATRLLHAALKKSIDESSTS